MTKIVECVPNYSISGDEPTIQKITEPFRNTAHVHLVNVEGDTNYNRTVVTVIGEPQAVMQAVIQSARIALACIDMRKHHGEHKRMGATDVIPFIPIQDMSNEETIALSEACAKALNEATDIPVFLYSLSAKREQCINLPDIRKGEFEGMKEKLQDPMWKPDFGDSCHPSAGVTAVGCRPLLIAFNIDLGTNNRKVAAAVARMIRYSGGGYRCIQAGPVTLEDKGIVQVTMNITDFTKTSVYRAYEAVKMEAKRFDIEVIGSEFVGLVSLACLKDIAAYYLHLTTADECTLGLDEIVTYVSEHLQLHDFDKTKVIENYVH